MKSYHRTIIGQIAPLNARRFTATPRRPFLDECLVQTHTLISGIHDVTGLPWAASIPLTAFLVRIVVLTPINVYSRGLREKQWKLFSRFEESRIATEKKIKQEHGKKSLSELQKINDAAVGPMRRRLIKQHRALVWPSYLALIQIPIWLAMMETIRRMTGAEDGMLSLTGKSLTALREKQNPGPGTVDELIPTEPSLATEGMLWFDDLTIPDPSLILPFALSGIMFIIFSSRRGTLGFHSVPGSTIEHAYRAFSWSERKDRILKVGALVAGPATLTFPSAMLLYWISSSLAAVIVGPLPRILFLWVRKAPGEDKVKPKSKPKTQEFRGPTMKDLRNQRKKK